MACKTRFRLFNHARFRECQIKWHLKNGRIARVRVDFEFLTLSVLLDLNISFGVFRDTVAAAEIAAHVVKV